MSHHGGRLKAKKGRHIKGIMRLSTLGVGRMIPPGRICPENRTSAPSRPDDPLLREIAALSGETDRKITRLSNRIGKLLKEIAAG